MTGGEAKTFRDATVAVECREHPGPVIVEITGEEILALPEDGRAKAFLMARLAATLRLQRGDSWDERETRGVRAQAARELLLEMEIDRLKAEADAAYAELAQQARHRVTRRGATR